MQQRVRQPNPKGESIHPGFVTRFRLRFEDCSPESANLIEADLEQLAGVGKFQINFSRHWLKVSYDGSQHSIDDISKLVENRSASLKQGWWQRFRLGMQRQRDKNIRDNASHEPHCCNKPPAAGLRRR